MQCVVLRVVVEVKGVGWGGWGRWGRAAPTAATVPQRRRGGAWPLIIFLPAATANALGCPSPPHTYPHAPGCADSAPDSPLNCDAGNLLRGGDVRGFNSMARMYTLEYAMAQQQHQQQQQAGSSRR